jgi:hypothetical protein
MTESVKSPRKRTRDKIVREILDAFERGAFKTELINGMKQAVFCFYVEENKVMREEEFMFRGDCTVEYRGKWYSNPWDMFSEIPHGTTQPWVRRVYQGGHTIQWHLRKRK